MAQGTNAGVATSGKQSLAHAALKYAKNLKTISACPPVAAEQLDVTAFRFSFADKADQRNFQPVAIMQPSRLVCGHPIADCCSGYALSSYTSLTELQSRAKAGLRTSPLFLKRVGDHFAKFQISSNDGLCTQPGGSGHFDCHEFANFDGHAATTDHGLLLP
jgi:hypothetical protein